MRMAKSRANETGSIYDMRMEELLTSNPNYIEDLKKENKIEEQFESQLFKVQSIGDGYSPKQFMEKNEEKVQNNQRCCTPLTQKPPQIYSSVKYDDTNEDLVLRANWAYINELNMPF